MTEAENVFNLLKSLKNNVPKWGITSEDVARYNALVARLGKAITRNLDDYLIPNSDLKPRILGQTAEGKQRFSDELYCPDPAYLSKLDAVLMISIERQERTSTLNAMQTVEMICKRSSDVVHEMKDRSRDREPLLMADEYDVQYLLGGLLRLHFDDIRREEWTPSYAGGSAKMDFLLKAEKVVIETKMTREALDANELGKQLLVDIAKYEEHADCKTLVCLVYDPTGRIKNAPGVIADLEKKSGRIKIKVFIER
jgi:hypothetical protein